MINTIIVPTDGSGHANKAIEMAGEIAVKFGARRREGSAATCHSPGSEGDMPGDQHGAVLDDLQVAGLVHHEECGIGKEPQAAAEVGDRPRR